MSKYLVAPMNWGLGHASRCIPLVRRLIREGHEVILGGDGESLTLLRKHFPKLRYTYLAPLNLRYSAGKSQVWAMLKALPKLFLWSLKDHAMLQAVLREEPIDYVLSDNRFGLYINRPSTNDSPCMDHRPSTNDHRPSTNDHRPTTIYLTHQLHIMLPRPWRWLEPLVARLHARIYTRFNKVWIPDYEDADKSLAGELSHLKISNLNYIGPLSRFEDYDRSQDNPIAQSYTVVAVLSGLEPHRTLLEKEIVARYLDTDEQVLIVQGLVNRPNTRFKRRNITLVPSITDAELVPVLMNAKHIIARSGYSTIMDLHALGLLPSKNETPNPQIELIPTPGQPEQEYLSAYFAEK